MYKLSEKTCIQVATGADSSQYVKLTRTVLRDRWLNFSAKVWRAIVPIADSISADMKTCSNWPDNEEKVYEIEDVQATTLKLSRFNGATYVGFCVLNSQFRNIINLNEAEWYTLMVVVPEISDKMATVSNVNTQDTATPLIVVPTKPTKKRAESMTKHSQAVKKLGFGSQHEVVQSCGGLTTEVSASDIAGDSIMQYQWVLQDGGDEVQMGPWTFLKDDCEKDGMNAFIKANAEQLALVINTRPQLLPHPLELFKMVYSYMMCAQSMLIAEENCLGCTTDHPSQFEHLMGCLIEETSAVDFYMQSAREHVSVASAVDVIRLLYEKYNIPSNPIFMDPVNLPDVTSADIYTYSLLDNKDYKELFSSLQGR